MSTPVATLCQLLVENALGEFAAQVFETLCLRGRLSLPAIIVQSGLSPRQVRHCLAVLVQQNLVVWCADSGGETASYEPHIRNAYNLVRHGKLLTTIEEQAGSVGKSIVARLLQSGHGRVGDLVKTLSKEHATAPEEDGSSEDEVSNTKVKPKVNGKVGKNSAAVEELSNEIRATVLLLIQIGFLTLARDSHFRPSSDNEMKARDVLLLQQKDQKVKKSEEVKFNEDVRALVSNWNYNSVERDNILERTTGYKITISLKRRAEANGHSDERSSKRARLEHDKSNIQDVEISWNRLREQELKLLDTMLVRINHDRLAVDARNRKLADLADLRIGTATSLIYGELLKRRCKEVIFARDSLGTTFMSLESENMLSKNEDDDSKAIPTRDIASNVDLTGVFTGFGVPPPRKTKSRQDATTNGDAATDDEDEDDEDEDEIFVRRDRKIKTESTKSGEPTLRKQKSNKAAGKSRSTVDSDVDVDDDDDEEDVNGSHAKSNDKVANVKQHLLLLKEYQPPLAKFFPFIVGRGECWDVNFAQVSHHLRLNMMDDIIRARFGNYGLRIVRILREKGKLEQKHLSTFSLMNHKNQLTILTALHKSGYLELQEVPKDSTRISGKTMFLWFFDERRCAIKMLEDVYKAMTKMLQRVRLESEKFRNVIEKSQRSDVVGKEEEMLTKHEKQQLATWHHIEDKLLTEVERIDDVVFALRDF